MKYITINPGFNQHLTLELGEEYQLTMESLGPTYLFDGKVVRTTINLKVPDIATPFAFTPPTVPVHPLDGETFECCKHGTIPDSYIPNVARLVFIKNVWFDNLYEAIGVTEHMNQLIAREGIVSIATFNRLIGIDNSTKNDKKHGWHKGDFFTVENGKYGRYELRIPAAHYFSEKKTVLDASFDESQIEKNQNKITCLHCAHVYSLDLLYHSVVNVGTLNIQGIKSDKLHDAWNCPACGGQFLGRERFPTIK